MSNIQIRATVKSLNTFRATAKIKTPQIQEGTIEGNAAPGSVVIYNEAENKYYIVPVYDGGTF